MSFAIGGETTNMEQLARLEKLVASLQKADAESGLQTLDVVLSMQGQVDTAYLQKAYVDGLMTLLQKTPSDSVLQEIDRRLRNTPEYTDSTDRLQSHADGLVKTVKSRITYAEALATSELLPAIPGYGSSLSLQKAHAEALFFASQAAGAKPLDAASRIEKIPSFRDSVDIQFACARCCCNATVQQQSKDSVRAIAMIEALPLRSASSDIAECLEKAHRNQTRRAKLNAPTKRQLGKAPVFAGAALVIAALTGIPALLGSDTVEANASPTPIAVSVPENDLASYLKRARAALRKGDADEATTYGIMALRLAETLGKVDQKEDSLDLLGTAYTHLGQSKPASVHFQQIAQSHLPTYIDRHVAAAEQALSEKDLKKAQMEAGAIVQLVDLSQSAIDQSLLRRGAAVCQQSQLPSQAGRLHEHLGELDKAAEFAEAAEQFPLALELLKRHIAVHPEHKDLVTQFRKRAGTKALAKAESALAAKKLEDAEAQAEQALEQLANVKEAKEEKAASLTVLAKVAYLKNRFPEAARMARQALATAPNPDRQARAKSYSDKDAELLTADELQDLENFVFPPAKKSQKYYTYAYVFGAPGDYVSGGEEELFEAPKNELKVELTYSRPEQGVSARLISYDGRYYSFDFDAGAEKVLKPGLYQDATRAAFNHNNPGVTYSGNGRGCNTSRGKFIVHEIVYGPGQQIESFAADFVTACDSQTAGAYGKIRFNTHYE